MMIIISIKVANIFKQTGKVYLIFPENIKEIVKNV